MPPALRPPCPPITATACAACAASRNFPKSLAPPPRRPPASPPRPAVEYRGGGGALSIRIFPAHWAELFAISFAKLAELIRITSASTPFCGVEPTQPIASTINLRRTGLSKVASAEPRVHPRHSGQLSV